MNPQTIPGPLAAVEAPTRVPKQHRSRRTRLRLLEAAVTCLVRDGWSGATMTVIAEEAGTSRGAMQHHFPTREDLITAALEHTFEQRMAALAAVQVPEGEGAYFVVRLVIDYYTDDLFKAALQMWAAAAADPGLRERITPLERRFAREVHQMAVRLLGADDSDPNTRALIQATLDLARGLGLADLLSDDSRRRAPIAKAWAAQLASAIRLADA